MKTTLQLIILSLLLFLFSCKGKTIKHEEIVAEEVEVPQTQTIVKKEKISVSPTPAIQHEYLYVSAKSGLNYRTKPKGEVLGKFPINTRLKILVHTNIFEEITDNNKPIKGEWLGVENLKDTVYVFSAFLSEAITFSDLDIFYASPSYEAKDERGQAFVNLSELYPYEYESETSIILHESELGKNNIQLDQKRKNTFLAKANIDKNDIVFIYNLQTDKVYQFPVKDLPVVARVNVYASDDSILKEYDYEFGLGLGEQYTDTGENFTYLGKSNPFQIGKVKAIVWTKNEEKDHPAIYNADQIKEQFGDEYLSLQSLEFSHNNFQYFLQDIAKENYMGGSMHRHLVAVDAETKQVVYDDLQTNTESISLMPISIEGQEQNPYALQWTGTVFKNKPPILYGFIGESFGCVTIDFLSVTEPPIVIRCDNRH